MFESMCFVVKLHHILIWGWLKMSSEHPMDVYKTSTQWFEQRYIISTSAIIGHMDHNYCWIFKLRMDFCGTSIKWINNNRNLIESVSEPFVCRQCIYKLFLMLSIPLLFTSKKFCITVSNWSMKNGIGLGEVLFNEISVQTTQRKFEFYLFLFGIHEMEYFFIPFPCITTIYTDISLLLLALASFNSIWLVFAHPIKKYFWISTK